MKIFAVSDIHSYFTIFKGKLDEVGFEANNPNHLLVLCGDCFDRGSESKELLHFLMQLDNKVLIKGNHEQLFEEMCLRGFPYGYDQSNGTYDTAHQLADALHSLEPFNTIFDKAYHKTAAYRAQLVNYFETENYIFCHSFIPTETNDWRNGNWEEATWENPFSCAAAGLNTTGKTIISGHWHCSTGHAILEGTPEFGEGAKWDPYIDEEHKFIGIDRCTAHTGECNILVLEDELL